jgi:hypothetical protein
MADLALGFLASEVFGRGPPILSPFIFLTVAEVLQQLIKANSESIRHPLSPEHPCPVLRYADDTLIVFSLDRAFNPFFIKRKKTKCPSYTSDSQRWREAIVGESQQP